MNRLATYLRRNAGASLLNSGASALATAALLPIVIRNVGMEAYGLWATLGIFIGLTSALDFGLSKSVVLLLSRQGGDYSRIVSAAILLCLGAGTVFLSLMFLLLGFRVEILGAQVAQHGDLVWWVAAGGCVILYSSLLTNIARAVMEARLLAHWVNVGFAILTLMQYAVAVLVSLISPDPRALVVGSALVYLMVLVAHVICVARLAPVRWQAPVRNNYRRLLSYGWKTFLSDIPSIALAPLVMYLLLMMVDSSSEYGTFDIAFKIAVLGATTLGLISAPIFAVVAAADGPGLEQARVFVNRCLVFTSGLGLLGWLTFWVIGEALLGIVFGPKSHDIFQVALLLLAGAATLSALEPIVRWHMGLGNMFLLTAVRSVMLFASVLAIFLLGQLPVLTGFALSCLAGYLASAAALVALHIRSERHRARDSHGVART